jgi:hypothetical protein
LIRDPDPWWPAKNRALLAYSASPCNRKKRRARLLESEQRITARIRPGATASRDVHFARPDMANSGHGKLLSMVRLIAQLLTLLLTMR